MFKIFFNNTSRGNVDGFISNYEKRFTDIFDDSGIEDEILIKKLYSEAAETFKTEIYKKTLVNLQEDVIHKMDYGNGSFTTTVLVNNFRLFIHFLEDEIEKIRYIEKIEFYRK